MSNKYTTKDLIGWATGFGPFRLIKHYEAITGQPYDRRVQRKICQEEMQEAAIKVLAHKLDQLGSVQ